MKNTSFFQALDRWTRIMKWIMWYKTCLILKFGLIWTEDKNCMYNFGLIWTEDKNCMYNFGLIWTEDKNCMYNFGLIWTEDKNCMYNFGLIWTEDKNCMYNFGLIWTEDKNCMYNFGLIWTEDKNCMYIITNCFSGQSITLGWEKLKNHCYLSLSLSLNPNMTCKFHWASLSLPLVFHCYSVWFHNDGAFVARGHKRQLTGTFS